MTLSFKGTMAGVFFAAIISAGSVWAADPIEGTWKTEAGESALIGKCGSAYCITVTTGKHAGKQVGKMSGGNGSYSGTITDPADDKQYSGSAEVKGNGMKLKGCALKIFCKTQRWQKL